MAGHGHFYCTVCLALYPTKILKIPSPPTNKLIRGFPLYLNILLLTLILIPMCTHLSCTHPSWTGTHAIVLVLQVWHMGCQTTVGICLCVYNGIESWTCNHAQSRHVLQIDSVVAKSHLYQYWYCVKYDHNPIESTPMVFPVGIRTLQKKTMTISNVWEIIFKQKWIFTSRIQSSTNTNNFITQSYATLVTYKKTYFIFVSCFINWKLNSIMFNCLLYQKFVNIERAKPSVGLLMMFL